jgi:hypothetical protein
MAGQLHPQREIMALTGLKLSKGCKSFTAAEAAEAAVNQLHQAVAVVLAAQVHMVAVAVAVAAGFLEPRY